MKFKNYDKYRVARMKKKSMGFMSRIHLKAIQGGTVPFDLSQVKIFGVEVHSTNLKSFFKTYGYREILVGIGKHSINTK